jgi:hypothetical protein
MIARAISKLSSKNGDSSDLVEAIGLLMQKLSWEVTDKEIAEKTE